MGIIASSLHYDQALEKALCQKKKSIDTFCIPL